MVYLNVGELSYPLILHFSSYFGVDAVGGRGSVWGIVAIAALVAILNAFIGATFFYRERVLTYLFFATNVLIALLSLVAVANIIALN